MHDRDLHLKKAIVEGQQSHRLDDYPDEVTAGHWDRNFKWVEPPTLNPCRSPPGWYLLDAWEPIQQGDIYWSQADERWVNTFANDPVLAGATPYFYGHPYARKLPCTVNALKLPRTANDSSTPS